MKKICFVIFALISLISVNVFAAHKAKEIAWFHIDWQAKENIDTRGCNSILLSERTLEEALKAGQDAADSKCSNFEEKKSGTCPGGKAKILNANGGCKSENCSDGYKGLFPGTCSE